jgi:hypothetical protein
VDICFIKPQDLPALSIAICAWRFIKDKRPSRSEILSEYSVHRQEGWEGEEAPELNILAGDEARSWPDDPPARTGWKPKWKQKTASHKLNQARHFIREEYLQRAQVLWLVLRQYMNKVHYIKRNKEYKGWLKSTPPQPQGPW